MENQILRHYWLDLIYRAWKKRSIVWIVGVRRTGKTTLCQTLEGVEYFDCELPRVRRMMEDPEGFLSSLKGKKIVLDEIHRLSSPSELLKISADHYPEVKIVATGSSTLSASRKFKDTLTGRKIEVWLTPMIESDLTDFRKQDLSHRFLHGGLPPFFLEKEISESEFQEWMDSYWAKDIQELFHLERHSSFQKFTELLMTRSSGIFDATKFASECGVSRTTIMNYLSVLELTFVAHIIRPYSTRRATEIIAAPKVYGFDTGFVCYHRGWDLLRKEDKGLLWEHYVLNELFAHLQSRDIHYWRDKRGHEIDFVLAKRGQPLTTIECKWSSSEFDPNALRLFRAAYPEGKNFVVSHDLDRVYTQRYGDLCVEFVSLKEIPSITI